MRICMVISVPLPPQEGIGYYVWNLSRFLVEQGHQVQIITRGQRGKPSYEKLGELQIWRPRFYPTYPLHVHVHRLFVQHLVRQLEAEIDIFHLHTPLPPPICSKRPALLTVHSMMLYAARERRTDSLFEIMARLQLPVSVLIEKQLLRMSQTVTAVSKPVAEHVRHVLSQDDREIEIAWNGVDLRVFSPGTHNFPDRNHLIQGMFKRGILVFLFPRTISGSLLCSSLHSFARRLKPRATAGEVGLRRL